MPSVGPLSLRVSLVIPGSRPVRNAPGANFLTTGDALDSSMTGAKIIVHFLNINRLRVEVELKFTATNSLILFQNSLNTSNPKDWIPGGLRQARPPDEWKNAYPMEIPIRCLQNGGKAGSETIATGISYQEVGKGRVDIQSLPFHIIIPIK